MCSAETWRDEKSPAEMLSKDNISRFIKGLPAKAQMVLRGLVHMEAGCLRLTLPDGRTFVIKGRAPGPNAAVTLHNWNLPQRALANGTIGVAESYMDGDWESPDVGAFLELFLVNAEMGRHFPNGARGLLRFVEKLRHWMNANTKAGSKRNISAHYDLGNAFYAQWLDPSMTYSSALYTTGANDLQSAQRAKYKALADAAGIGPNDHVLEIGCGWGGFAEYAASEIGCRVTGLTISREQLDFARARMEKAGLADKVDIKFQDYRDETGTYDRVVSIEMFEAVGEKFWPTYFSQVRRCLKPGGRAGLQIITIKPESYREYRANPDFIQKYVFPGGMLPTREHLVSLGSKVGLTMVGDLGFGLDYARTLAEWRERFWLVWPKIEPLGFDLRFKRLWEFYLFYCEAGFRAKNIDVRQVVYE
ncbi:cyclopropane-fatty-acyl-phospholipid synthase [Rhizobium sp. Leaf384]|uniref:SAM-dependent methyltransferase n=1 Tax=unclassified Rhizobium TaxID=2613769 RepID=UPI000713C17A|nr:MULTISPECIES: cyclopropane-fatty-acyl-phospholipid synthase family protein [unclassified Rhizobium]KQR67805.1 cyclopropane-fatty-acyl-phospholipid synthase [Rhizobium sp. Leaf341]KQS74368.1 cyclopropane-fatty-acyl-phospholipid synthase [Rhizobium sp. Leaf383]KQS80107.1 cyclopropane-fatty-acyl-phospholipid synthase [Rhizobium sp. Leaf384]